MKKEPPRGGKKKREAARKRNLKRGKILGLRFERIHRNFPNYRKSG